MPVEQDSNVIVILHDAMSSDAAPDRRDTLTQVEAVERSLEQLGWSTHRLIFELNLATLATRLHQLQPLLVFNLVESVDGNARLLHWAAGLLEHLRLPFSGCGSRALFATGDKLLAKRAMRDAGIPTPEWRETTEWTEHDFVDAGPWIIKPVAEDASFGLDSDSVVNHPGLLVARLRSRSARLGGTWFVERYVDGREFNLSLLAGPLGPEVLPVAEIEFVGFPPDRPRIIDYETKWSASSKAGRGTQRRFDFTLRDAKLIAKLKVLALRCWALFDLRGYARVDLRVDRGGQPWVLEINANPCLSPDAGFVAAAARANLDYTALIERLLPVRRKPRAA
jgi:D-alanine-D-alanine ligase